MAIGWTASLFAGMVGIALAAAAENGDIPVATVNNHAITEADMALAEAEIGQELPQADPLTHRRYLIEFLIENEIFAEAARTESVEESKAFTERLNYWRRRIMRDVYFERHVKDGITESAARALYEEKIRATPPAEEVRARHILVKTEEEAKAIAASLAGGADFAKLAEEKSLDAATKGKGGDLGFFGHGKLVPQVEMTAFKLADGQVSPPVESPYGWHIVKTEARRQTPQPPFEVVKDRITAAMTYTKTQTLAIDLRKNANVQYVDPDLRKMVEAQNYKAEEEETKKRALLEKIESKERSETAPKQ